MLTLILFFLTLFILVIVHEYGHFIVARLCGVKVLRFSFGFGKRILSYTSKKGTEYTWGLIPLGGYVSMLNDEDASYKEENKHQTFENQPAYQKMLIILAGPFFNFLFTWLALWVVLMIGIPTFTGKMPPIIEKVMPHSPAALAGLKPKDKILTINQQPINDWFDVIEIVRSSSLRVLNLRIERFSEKVKHTLDLTLLPVKQNHRGFIGIVSPKPICNGPCITTLSYSPLPALYQSGMQTLELIKQTTILLSRMITGRLNLEGLSGPIGIAQTAQNSAAHGWIYYLNFLALVSMSLGMINLVPIPLLDGGAFLFVLIEFIRRKPLSPTIKEKMSVVGFMLIGSLMIFAIYNDLTKWLS